MITVYKFSAEWCGPCKSYEPIFNEVSKNFDKLDIEFKKIDIDEDNENLVNKYSIKHVPMTIIDVNGEVKLRRVGNLSESILIEEINKVYDSLNDN